MAIVISIIFIVIIISIILTKCLYDFNLKNQARMSFDKTFKKTGTPVVTLKDRTGKSLNFLVDTGSNLSHLKLGVINDIADAEKVIKYVVNTLMPPVTNRRPIGFNRE